MNDDSIAWSLLILDHHLSCYHDVLAFDIEGDGNISDLAIQGSTITNQTLVMCLMVSQGIYFIESYNIIALILCKNYVSL